MTLSVKCEVSRAKKLWPPRPGLKGAPPPGVQPRATSFRLNQSITSSGSASTVQWRRSMASIVTLSNPQPSPSSRWCATVLLGVESDQQDQGISWKSLAARADGNFHFPGSTLVEEDQASGYVLLGLGVTARCLLIPERLPASIRAAARRSCCRAHRRADPASC